MKLLTLDQLNKTQKITLYHSLFGMYIIDKCKKTIIEQKDGKTIDITEKCKSENDRFVFEGIMDTVKYNCGVVFWKILNESADKECKNFLKNFDSITIE